MSTASRTVKIRNPRSTVGNLISLFAVRNLQFAGPVQGEPAFARAIAPSRFLLLALYTLLLLAACAPQPLTVTREPVALRLVAADSCGSLAEELAAAYEGSHPWVTVQVEVFNSSVAERTLRAGGADLALLSWLEETDERPLWSQRFARDGVAVVLHPATPFAETGLAHLQEIFRGRVQEWGGMVLTVVSREEGSGARAAFESVVMDGHDVTFNAVVMPSSEAVIEYVARTPGAIGYVSTLRIGERSADGVRVPPVEGTLPTPDAIADGTYPLSRPLYLASTAEPTGEAREFAQWLLGPESQDLIGRFSNR
jgi:phosphate transport system substrate-binding protein